MDITVERTTLQKSQLEKFIQLYKLGGNINSAWWTVKNNRLYTDVTADNRSVVGYVTYNNIILNDNEFGIHDTDKLSRFIGILNDEINVSFYNINGIDIALQFNDGNIDSRFALADKSVIERGLEISEVPEFNIRFNFDSDFIEKFIKAKSALSELETFAILSDDSGTKVILGYDENTNSSRITFNVQPEEHNYLPPISFSSTMFKEILSANKNIEGGFIEVSEQGLARVLFECEEYKAEYYLIKMETEE